MGKQWIRKTLDLQGVIQGVGFRPAIYRLAREAGLGGSVQNRSASVRLVLEGEQDQVAQFLARLEERLPQPVRIESLVTVSEEPLAIPGHTEFDIAASAECDVPEVLIPADLAVCPDCTSELFDPLNRRYGYAFTTCTACGPRYTVLNAMPYDRIRTTMKAFPLCPDCQQEYETPSDRRFHAESIACPVCGPQVWIEDSEGMRLSMDPIRLAREALAQGKIVAVRGLGGFLLAANALNRDVVGLLRERKYRPHKPFAVMARDLDGIRRYCQVPDAAAALLSSREAPAVILAVKNDPGDTANLPLDLITPDTATMGVMLPTTPLHHLLMSPLTGDPVPAFDLLIMTSGNRHGEPICIRNEEARQRLAGIADYFLMHNREINLRNDDSVCVIRGDDFQVWRRARGFAPNPQQLPFNLDRVVLAMGADMKNTVAVGYGNRVILSPHVGDLDTLETLDGFEYVARTLPEFLGRDPEAVATDRHPDMNSTRLGERVAKAMNVPIVPVQHHHAHAAACLAENGLSEGLVLVMDGTGWGNDDTIWGAELLDVRGGTFRRLASFMPAPLPGGDAAVRRPARQLVGRWVAAGIALTDERLKMLDVSRAEADTWEQQCTQRINAPMTHAAGRVFDSFSVALGLASRDMTYEGQPAIRLEAVATSWDGNGDLPDIPFNVTRRDDGLLLIDWSPAFLQLANMTIESADRPRWAMAVHVAVVRAAVVMIQSAICHQPEQRLGISGGVFMNRILDERLEEQLGRNGIAMLRHRWTPPGDGCIALGQAVVAGSC